MNISIIGAGYVGLVTGTCLAEIGMNIICMDIDAEKINRLKDGNLTVYEPGLDQIFENNYFYTRRLSFTANLREAVEHAEVIFIAVNTPTLDDGSADLGQVLQAAREIACCMAGYRVIVIKSTVPVGTCKLVKEEMLKTLHHNGRHVDFDIVSNPEFLREGAAVKDFMMPERIIIGTDSDKARNILESIYRLHTLMGIPVIAADLETAEMIKYASNTFLAVKISFINEIARICELCGADASIVSKAMGMDSRIGSSFLNPGPGYGGSCLPKDTRAFVNFGKSLGYTPKIVKNAIEVNEGQKRHSLSIVKKAVGGLKNKKITVLGLSFKPGTDDIREAPSIALINKLLAAKAEVRAVDPKACPKVQTLYPELPIHYYSDVYAACTGCDCIVLMTEWEQFAALDFDRLARLVRKPVFIDLRNSCKPDEVKRHGFSYRGVGRR